MGSSIFSIFCNTYAAASCLGILILSSWLNIPYMGIISVAGCIVLLLVTNIGIRFFSQTNKRKKYLGLLVAVGPSILSNVLLQTVRF